MAISPEAKKIIQQNSVLRRILKSSSSISPQTEIKIGSFLKGDIKEGDIFKQDKSRLTEIKTEQEIFKSLPREELLRRTIRQRNEKRTFENELQIQESQDILQAALDEIFDVSQDPTGRGVEAESTGQQIFQELGRPEEEVQAQQQEEVIDFLERNNKKVTEETIKLVVDQLNQGATLN